MRRSDAASAALKATSLEGTFGAQADPCLAPNGKLRADILCTVVDRS